MKHLIESIDFLSKYKLWCQKHF